MKVCADAARRATLTLLVLLLVLMLTMTHPASSEEPLYVIPLDTCSYVVVREIASRGLSNIVVVLPADAPSLPEGSRVAVVTSIEPEGWLNDFVSKAIAERGARVHAYSDILRPGGVPSHLMRRYCQGGSEEALQEVAMYFVLESSFPLPLFLGLVAAGAASLFFSSSLKELARRLSEAPLAILIALFRRRGRLSDEELINHPLRASIIKALEGGPIDFSTLQSKLGVSRASLEWHLATLIAYGVVREEKKGRKRVYLLAEDSQF